MDKIIFPEIKGQAVISNELMEFPHGKILKATLEDGTTVMVNNRAEVVELGNYSKLVGETTGDHALVYQGDFKEVLVWKKDHMVSEWRWTRPMFIDRFSKDDVRVVYLDEYQGDEDEETGEITPWDKEVLYRSAIHHLEQEFQMEFLVARPKKLIFGNPKVFGKVWDSFVGKNKGTDSQFMAGMMLRPGFYKDESENVRLPSRKASEFADGVGISFPAKDWKKVLAYFGLSDEVTAMQVTYMNPATGDAFKGTVSLERKGLPAGTYDVTWKYLSAKSINLKWLSIMNVDSIIDYRVSMNQQVMYYELNREQQQRCSKLFLEGLDQIADLSRLAGAGEAITAGHLVKHGMNPLFGGSAEEIQQYRYHMAIKSCRKTSVKGWTKLVMPSEDLFHNQIRVPKDMYRQFKKYAKRHGLRRNELLALTLRNPTLPTGGSMQKYFVVGVSTGNVIEVGMGMNPKTKETQWGSRQLGDFDGDTMSVFHPELVREYLFDFECKDTNNQQKYKPSKGVVYGTDKATRVEQLIKEATISIGLGDSLGRQAIDSGFCGEQLQEYLETCAMAVQAAITAKKYETEQVEPEQLQGSIPVEFCPFNLMKKLPMDTNLELFKNHPMLQAVGQALDTAKLEAVELKYKPTQITKAFVEISVLFDQKWISHVMKEARTILDRYFEISKAVKVCEDVTEKSSLKHGLNNIRKVEIPLLVESFGLFGGAKPKGYIGNIFTEQHMRRALMAFAIAHQLPGEIRVWAMAMDREMFKLFLPTEEQEAVLIGDLTHQEIINGMTELVVDDNGKCGSFRFAVDHYVPTAGRYVCQVINSEKPRRWVVKVLPNVEEQPAQAAD